MHENVGLHLPINFDKIPKKYTQEIRKIQEMSKAEVTLLDCWVSPFCMRVKIALEEKGVAYESQAEDLFGGKSELLLTSNPHGKVPVLLHNEKPVCESAIIVAYIDETWTSSSFLPPCAYGRAQARFWADYIDKKVFDAGRAIFLGKGEDIEVGVKDFIEAIKTLEKTLGDKDFFGGEIFGFVDIIGIAMTSWFPAYEKYGCFKLEDHCPKFCAWIKRSSKRESVAKVIPEAEKVLGFVAMFRQMMGVEG